MMYLITLSFVVIFLQLTEISSLKCIQSTIHNQRINKLSFINYNNNIAQKRQIATSTITRNSSLFSQSNSMSSFDVTTTNNKQSSIMSKLFNIALFKHLTILLSTILLFTKQAFAASSTAAYKSSTASNGWDIYGRVPYDDWLFSTWRLTDPNLLRRSYVECVSGVYMCIIV